MPPTSRPLKLGSRRRPGRSHKARVLIETATDIALTNARAGVRARLRGRELPPGVERTGFDPLDPAVITDPYPAYRRLLAGGPVHYNPRRGLFVLSRFEDVRAAARADGALSSAQGVIRTRFALPILLTTDRPEHTRMRRLAMPGFTKGALGRWQPTIDRLAAELVGDLRAAGGGEVVSGLAVPMPVQLIAHILGIPPEDQDTFRRWSNDIVEAAEFGFDRASLGRFVKVTSALLKFSGYIQAQIASGRLFQGDSVLAQLCASSEEGEITADELFWFAVLLLLAGNETTTNLLSTMILTLAQHPGQYELLRAEPGLVPSAVEEHLRYISPIQGFYRTATTGYQVGSATIPAGSRVLILFGAANRDPRQFADPGRFSVERDPAGHLAFGSGIHLCLGAHLARMEARAVLRELLAGTERIELTGTPVWGTNSALRGLTRLPVRLIAGR